MNEKYNKLTIIKKEEMEKGLPTEIELSKTILDSISIEDIIYSEIAEGGAMGCPGQIMFYILKEEELVCYKTDLFKDENTYLQVQALLLSHQKEPLSTVNQEVDILFNYYYGGMGNHVFVNKGISPGIAENHFVYEKHNKQYRIYSSVLGVFDAVVREMQNSEMQKTSGGQHTD